MNPIISVVVPAYNAQETLSQCLSAIRASLWKDYELIVFDDGSEDETSQIASRFADKVIRHPENRGRTHTRNNMTDEARGEIIVSIDSDIIVQPNALSRIEELLRNDQDISAVTGLLAKEHPNPNFSSQYKNLYMHHMFKNLPRNVAFLYGSIFAIRRNAAKECRLTLPFAEDTQMGQQLVGLGRKIILDKNLAVVHLKKYTLRSLIKNDFRIPFHWAHLFLKNRGWKQWGRNGTGFAHSSRSQLLSLIVAPLVLATFGSALFNRQLLPAALGCLILWLGLNWDFFRYMHKERGLSFALRSVAFTFLDNGVMLFGVFCGALDSLGANLRQRS